MDAIRDVPFGSTTITEGDVVTAFEPENSYPTLPRDSRQYQDMLRFHHFSQGFNHQREDGLILDSRYGLPPHSSNSMWALEVNPTTPNEHGAWRNIRSLSAEDQALFWQLLKGK